MATLGSFYPDVVTKLNKLLAKYPIAPGYGENDETTYWVGIPHDDDYDWESLNNPDLEEDPKIAKFLDLWNEIKDVPIFEGKGYILRHPRTFSKFVSYDQIARAFKLKTKVSVLEILGQAYRILWDPETDATMRQGPIGSVEIAEVDNVPALIFTLIPL